MLNVKTLTDTMSRMELPQLQQYAALHKNDPYVVSLALSIANQKKQADIARAGQAGMMPQPKVVDRDIFEIPLKPEPRGAVPPQQQQSMLPEDTGIAQLPAQNMQGMNMAAGGIVAFDGGGEVPGYAPGGQVKQAFAEKYHDAAVRAGAQLGVDPSIIISQWGLETGWGKSIIPGTNNLGNIKDFSGKGVSAYDKAEKSTSKYKKYNSTDDFADDYVNLIKRKFPDAVGAGNDVNKFTAGLRPGEKGGYATDESYGTKLARTFNKFLPIGTASAEETSRATPQSTKPTQPELDTDKKAVVSAGIPGLSAITNALTGAYEALTPSFSASTTVPQAAARTAATAGPLSGIGLLGGLFSSGATNALSNATPEQLDQLSSDIGSDTGLAAAIMNAPNRPPEKPPMSYGEQMTNVGKFLVGHPDVRKPEPPPAPTALPPVGPYTDESVRLGKLYGAGPTGPVEGEEPAPVDEMGNVTGPAKGGMDLNDLMIKMGLGMMAGKSPHALTNVGEAGLQALQLTAAEKKAAAEQALQQAQADMYKQHALYYSQLPDLKGEQIDARTAIAAEQTITNRIKAIDANLMLTPEQKELEKARIRAEVYRQLKPSGMPSNQTAPTLPPGVTVKQTG